MDILNSLQHSTILSSKFTNSFFVISSLLAISSMDLVFSIFHHQRHVLCNHPPFYPIRVNLSMHRPRENALRKVAAESLVRGCPPSRRKEIQSSRRKRLFEEKKNKHHRTSDVTRTDPPLNRNAEIYRETRSMQIHGTELRSNRKNNFSASKSRHARSARVVQGCLRMHA